MANKTFNTRVKNKRDTAANWEAVATTFQPLDGELIIVDTAAGKTRFKVGRYDTAKGRLLYYNEIPFTDEYLYNDLNESQGKIYDKLKGIDDKSIIEMTLEPSDGNGATELYKVGLWQFPQSGFYKIKFSVPATSATLFQVFARETGEDGTTNEDFSTSQLKIYDGLGGDAQTPYVFVLADYVDNDSFTSYHVQFLNLGTNLGRVYINTYDKSTQKWSYGCQKVVEANKVGNALTLTKGDTTTKFDGSVAREVSIPTKTSELTNDSNFTTQTDLDNLTNTVVSYNAQENITDEQKAQARTNIGAISSNDLVQSDWNQNDTSSPAYIQNRPGGYYNSAASAESGTLSTTDFQDASAEFSTTSYIVTNEAFNTNLTNLKIAVGKTYKMSWVDSNKEYSYIANAVEINDTQNNKFTVILGDTTLDFTHNKLIWGSKSKVIFVLNGGIATSANTVTNIKIEEVNIAKIPEEFLDLSSVPEGFDLSKNYTAEGKGSLKYTSSLGGYTIIGFNEENVESNKWPRVEVSMQELDTSYVATTQYEASGIHSSWKDSSTNNFIHGIDINYDRYNKALILQSKLLDNTTEDLSVRGIATPTQDNSAVNKKYVDDKTIVDTVLSDTSTNPVQNKVIKAAVDDLQASIDSKPSAADAVYTATAASTDGVAYTATVSGIDSLTIGASFIMIPNKASTSKAPTLNVNGLGAKPIRRRLSSLTTSLQQGYSTNWIALNKPFTVVYDGTAWVIEGLTKTDGVDVYGAVAQATADAKGNNIADTYATIAMLQSLLPKVTTITLTSNWVGDVSPYYQDIALSCVTETSIVDLQPTPEQLNSWQDDGLAFTTLSGNGTVRVYVAGGKPSSAISVQVRVQEVTVI